MFDLDPNEAIPAPFADKCAVCKRGIQDREPVRRLNMMCDRFVHEFCADEVERNATGAAGLEA